jgi:hypothetical protein
MKIYVKYHLHKDGSPIWDITDNEQEARDRIEELKGRGYKSFIDWVFSKHANKTNLGVES